MSMRFWLMKSEPDTYSIDDLARDRITAWSGVRNFTARNNMMQMTAGDLILFYHSSCPENGVYGIGKIHTTARPDETQFDPRSEYYEPRAREEKPIWFCVDVAFVEKLPRPVLLADIKRDPGFSGMVLLERARLSVQSVSENHFQRIVNLASGTH
jgi:predicted RNA-binding protein with PUA-like domain